VQKAIHLMDSRLSALGNQFSVGMGTNHSGIDLLSPPARAAYQKLMGEEPKAANVRQPSFSDNGKQPANTAPALPDTAIKQLQPGHITTFANGQKWTIVNGTPQQVQ
jgi:hypothetical protein